MTNMNEAITEENQKIIDVIAKFKIDLLWDEVVGVMAKVPEPVKQQLNIQYEAALKAASERTNIPLEDLRDKVEDIAYETINGMGYTQKDIEARLKEYGIQVEENESGTDYSGDNQTSENQNN